jgi:precorrin-6B methylase 2
MPKKSLIDDVMLAEEDDKGRPIIFTNQEIRRMLTLSNAGSKDVFCDLGCGWGQNLIVALTEFKVAKAIGVEKDTSRRIKCEKRLKRWEKHYPYLHGRWSIVEMDFEAFLKSKIQSVNPMPSIIFYGLSSYKELIERIERVLSPGAKILYYFNSLFPEIMPEKNDFPFYVSTFPFKRPRSEMEWLNAVVKKSTSNTQDGQPSVEELWEELRHDADIYGDLNVVSDYKRRLKTILG